MCEKLAHHTDKHPKLDIYLLEQIASIGYLLYVAGSNSVCKFSMYKLGIPSSLFLKIPYSRHHIQNNFIN